MAESRANAQRSPQKSYREILRQEIDQGLIELNRSTAGLLISGLSAGLDLSFSLFLSAVMFTLTGDVPEVARAILMANVYSVGFIFVVLGRSELFTEHTTLAVLPVLNKTTTLGSLMRLWALVYMGNIAGAALFALLISTIGPAYGIIDPQAFAYLAHHNLAHQWWSIALAAVLAGWLMGLLSWLVTAARDTISQVLIVWLVTASIGLSHLPHCIAGTSEVLAGLFSGQSIGLSDYGHFLLWSTVGNAVGGVIFVAVIKYSHVIRSNVEPKGNADRSL